MPYAEVGGVRLSDQRAGRGAPELVFIPGWCCDHTAFQPQFDHFARTHGVTSLDLRGCGESDAPEDGIHFRSSQMTWWRPSAQPGSSVPVFVGHSLGGMIAVELAARYPSFASALVLVDPGPIDPLPETSSSFAASRTSLPGRTAT